MIRCVSLVILSLALNGYSDSAGGTEKASAAISDLVSESSGAVRVGASLPVSATPARDATAAKHLEGPRWFQGDAELQRRLAMGVKRWIDAAQADPRGVLIKTGSEFFDGEYLFGFYFMAGMGFGQAAMQNLERREEYLDLMGVCIDRLLDPGLRSFDTGIWGKDALDTLDGSTSHAGYLGYMNLLMSFHRLLDRNSKHAEMNNRITEALARGIEGSPTLLIETYPGATFPVDNCAAIASIFAYDRVTNANHSLLIARWEDRFRRDSVDPKTGLLHQRVDSLTSQPVDYPRGSGTCLGAYFLSFVDMDLSKELFDAAQKELVGSLIGFRAVREYPRGVTGRIDIDSGPIIFGYGVASTGFMLSCARIHNDLALFSSLYGTVAAFGNPTDEDGRRHYVPSGILAGLKGTIGPLGDAILFAILTALPQGLTHER